MANIQVIPLDIADVAAEDVVLANAALQVYPEESAWSYSNGDLTVGGYVPARSGSWVSRFNLENTEVPPLVQWKYDSNSENNTSFVIENRANLAYLRVNNIDLKPDPKKLYPDSHWEVNGLDLIPRG
jgi:hypothetical protein